MCQCIQSTSCYDLQQPQDKQFGRDSSQMLEHFYFRHVLVQSLDLKNLRAASLKNGVGN